jgi:hypothetical protein
MRMMAALVLLTTVSLSVAADAQSFRAACNVDNICQGVKRGGGRIFACLRTHESALTEQCYAALGHFMINRPPKAKNGA